MSVPSSIEELVQLIRKSGMVDEQKLNAYLQRRQFARGLPEDPREFADDMVRDGILTNFQSEQFLLGKWRGFTIGKYKLLERVGVGGMGQVFLCEHMFMKRRVAVKVLPPAKAEQPAALGRFYREARAAGSLEHPHIVRTHDIDQDGNLHFIVMEYVDGSDLLAVVKKFGALDIGRATAYVRQAAAGLDYAFRNGIIHRDIKPGNILVDRKGVARILDMGLARFYKDQSDQLTVKYDDKIVLGTADYVAPEQVANSHAVDIRADIYALGATFYFLLAGHPPFPTGTVSQKLLWHRTKEPTPIRQLRPDVPEGLAALVTRMMAKDPKARFQTPAQVDAELEHWVPAEIPLPAAEEMPQLSPAATEAVRDVVAVEQPTEVVAAAAAPAAEPRAAAANPFGAPPPAAEVNARKPASPFGEGPTWTHPVLKNGHTSGQRPGLAPPPPLPAQAGVDTAAEVQRTPTPPARASGPLDVNPFKGGDAPPAKQSVSWVTIAVILGAALAGGAIAVLKFNGLPLP
jgi:tRNA A-37 threonylcarbamoyl transferase component Bud32